MMPPCSSSGPVKGLTASCSNTKSPSPLLPSRIAPSGASHMVRISLSQIPSSSFQDCNTLPSRRRETASGVETSNDPSLSTTVSRTWFEGRPSLCRMYVSRSVSGSYRTSPRPLSVQSQRLPFPSPTTVLTGKPDSSSKHAGISSGFPWVSSSFSPVSVPSQTVSPSTQTVLTAVSSSPARTLTSVNRLFESLSTPRREEETHRFPSESRRICSTALLTGI